MGKNRWVFIGMIAALMALACRPFVTADSKVPRMTKEELRQIMERPDVVILDVRTGESWKRSDRMIKGAVRENPEKDVKLWANRYGRDKTLVFYCT